MGEQQKLDLFSPGTWDDPFPMFAKLRNSAPVLRIEQAGMSRTMFLVTSRDIIADILMKPDLFSSKFYDVLTGGSAPNPEAAEIYKTEGIPEVDVMLTTDEPQHLRYRSLVNKAFSPRRIAAMQSKIEEAADFLIDRFIERGECDFIEEFAIPLPIYMISDVLGIPRSRYQRFREWSDAFNLRNGQMGTPAQEVVAAKLIAECQQYLNTLVRERRVTPSDDMISDLVHATAEGTQPLTDVEILSILQQLLIAGNETTRSALIGLIAHLLDDPDQMEALLKNPDLVANAVEEALRYETPAATTWRIARQDIELAGVAIPAGSIIMARLDAANRDGHNFSNPEKFDVRRPDAKNHLTFGQGIHFCIGHVLARRELNIAMSKLLARVKDMNLQRDKTDMRIHPSVQFRTMRAVKITFKPGKPLAAKG